MRAIFTHRGCKKGTHPVSLEEPRDRFLTTSQKLSPFADWAIEVSRSGQPVVPRAHGGKSLEIVASSPNTHSPCARRSGGSNPCSDAALPFAVSDVSGTHRIASAAGSSSANGGRRIVSVHEVSRPSADPRWTKRLKMSQTHGLSIWCP